MQKIAKDVFHIPLMPRNSINCYIIEGVLIDSGIRSSFNKIQKNIKEVHIHSHALTHAHPDHQGCSDLICKSLGVPLYCHEKELDRTESGLVTSEYPSSKNIIARFQQKYWAGPGHIVTKTLKNGDSVEGFKVVETPGHSSGHISFFREKDGVLILGDVATNMNLLTTMSGLHPPPAIFTSEKDENINSLKEISKLNPRIICFGHGPVLNNRDQRFEKFVDKISG